MNWLSVEKILSIRVRWLKPHKENVLNSGFQTAFRKFTKPPRNGAA
jgi:hypothetical protein